MVKLVKPQIDVEKALKNPEAWIPRGIFCYAYNFDAGDPEEMTGYLCPFWDLREDKPEYENGYCHYLKRGDWEADHYSLLYDECKECGVGYDVGFTVAEEIRLRAMRGEVPSFEEVRAFERAWLATEEPDETPELAAALVARYPFLMPRRMADDEPVAGNWTMLTAMPLGWRRAFGLELAEDLRAVLLAAGGEEALRSYRVDQVKEKYGSLRWYDKDPACIDTEQRELLSDAVELYCAISERTCAACGSMAGVRTTKGWILPICRNERGYEDAEEMPPFACDGEFCTIIRYLPGGGTERRCCKELCVGADAPIVKTLGLLSPLHVTEVWDTLRSENGL